MISEFLVLFFVFTISLYILGQKRPKNYPPGPFGFPIIGHIPLLGIRENYDRNIYLYNILAFETLKKWKPKYGSVVAFELGAKKCVGVSDYKLIKEILNDPNVADRPEFPGIKELREGEDRGVIFSNGSRWVQQRRFTLRNLRDLGFGKKSMDVMINDEVEELVAYFRSQIGKPISTANKFNAAVVNSLWSLIYGQRFNQNDPELLKAIELLSLSIRRNGFSEILILVPWLEKIIPGLGGIGLKSVVDQFMPVIDFIKRKVKDHNNDYIEGEPRDFMDIYLDEVRATKDPTSSFFKAKGEKELIYTILDLFIAGAETTSTTLCWMLLYLAVFPEVQEKLQKEIKEVIGNSRMTKSVDRQNMPYLEAVIAECLRYSSLTPLGVSRCTSADIEFQGYKIPKNTWILPNTWSVHFDENIWGDPFNFRPERFLSKDGKSFIRSDHLLAFGSGRRVCLGEALARDELFLFTASIFQNFKITFDPSAPKPSLDPVVGGVLIPKDHKLIFNELK